MAWLIQFERLSRQPGIGMEKNQDLSRCHGSPRIHLACPPLRRFYTLNSLAGDGLYGAAIGTAVHHDEFTIFASFQGLQVIQQGID